MAGGPRSLGCGSFSWPIPNHYRPVLNPVTDDMVDDVNPFTDDRVTLSPVTPQPCHSYDTRTSKEPFTEPLSYESKKEESEKARKEARSAERRKPEIPLPDNWTPSVASMDKAKHLGL